MIDFANAYRDIFCDGLVLLPMYNSGEYYFELTEDDPSAKLSYIKINDVPEYSILINLQQIENNKVFEKLNMMFRKEESFFRICDYLLIAKEKQVKSTKPCLFFIFMEMKSEKPDNKDILEQFKGTSSFSKYLEAILEYNKDYIIMNKYDIRTFYVVFHLSKTARPPSWPKKKEFNQRVSQKPDKLENIKKWQLELIQHFITRMY